MKETEFPCGTKVTAEIMRTQGTPAEDYGVLIGVDINIYSVGQHVAGFFIAKASMVEAVKFLREAAEDYWEEETECSS